MALRSTLPGCVLMLLVSGISSYAADVSVRPYAAQPEMEPALSAIRLKNFQNAVRQLEPLASRGNANAQYLLASLYRAGLGVTADVARERSLLLAAAEQKHANAAYSLALSLQREEPRDLQGSRRWLEAAAQAGHEIAARSLKRGGLPLEFLPASDLKEPSARIGAFWSAAEGNDVALLALLASPDLISATNDFGRDALMRAAEAGAGQAVQELLRQRTDARRADRFGTTALMLAAASESEASLSALIKAGADVDAQDKVGNTALMHAARAERVENIRTLLAAMATTGKFNARNSEGWTALDWAIRGKSTPAIQALRAAGITATVAKREASTPSIPLRRAAKADLYAGWSDLGVGATRPSTGMLNSLIVMPRAEPWTAKELRVALGSAVTTGNVAAAEKLLPLVRSLGSTASSIDPQWFDWAIRHGDLKMVQLLLPFVPRNSPAKDVESPVLAATRAQQGDILAVLIDAGFDVGAPDKLGRDALMIATRANQRTLVDFLLKQGADPSRVDAEGRSALWYATQTGSVDVARLLVRPENQNLDDKQGISPLLAAASDGQTEIVALLLANGVSPNANGRNGASPLFVAAANGHAAAVQRLLAAGATANATGAFGNTALIVATRNGHAPIVKLLLAAGANRQLRNTDGNSATDIANALGHVEVEALLKAG
ncbi:MAG: ankyrin repeat domain-containing protein [Steroidobacteraceae bacterium]